jgi:hypothetical protein
LPSSIEILFNVVPMKGEPSTISTLRGITIDSRSDDPNTPDSIRFNDDGDSNEMDESNLQKEKQNEAIIVTNLGTTISFEILKQQISLFSIILIRQS